MIVTFMLTQIQALLFTSRIVMIQHRL